MKLKKNEYGKRYIEFGNRIAYIKTCNKMHWIVLIPTVYLNIAPKFEKYRQNVISFVFLKFDFSIVFEDNVFAPYIN